MFLWKKSQIGFAKNSLLTSIILWFRLDNNCLAKIDGIVELAGFVQYLNAIDNNRQFHTWISFHNNKNTDK